MKKFYLLLLTGFISISCFSQLVFSCIVKDAGTGEPLSNVSVVGKGDMVHTVTNNSGIAKFLIRPGKYVIRFSAPGYEHQDAEIDFTSTAKDSLFTILMKKSDNSGIIIYSTRTNSGIENNPSRVEVLGAKELDKEAGIKQSHIAGLLRKLPGIQTQHASAVTGITDLRIQGLPGKHTQVLRDGMPVFEGFANSFSILQIPPLDLKQIEIIKGASSALYGGGAISGMINFISKKPRADHPERSILINQSSLQGTHLNIFLSEKKGKVGYTFFVGGKYQKQKDINNDSFSDVPRQEAVTLHPAFYFYLNEKNTVSLSINSAYEDRVGGDMDILDGYFSNFHQFFIQNQTLRNTVSIDWENKINSKDKFTFKATTSSFNRDISSNVFGMKAKQLSYYSEASYVKKIAKHDIVAGLNLVGEKLKKGVPDSSLINNFHYFTVGLFAQDDWRIHPKLTIETGLRSDFHNEYGVFILPGIALLYKIDPYFTMRLSGGLGYKIPTVFESTVDERDYPKLQPLLNAKAEKSSGINWGINYKKKFGKLELAINQTFFYSQVNRPLVMQKTATTVSFFNASKPISSKGMESWLQLSFAGLESNLGYTFTDARRKYDPVHPYLDLNAMDKFAAMLSYKLSKNFRLSVDATHTGKQYLEDGRQVPAFTLVAAMMQLDVGKLTIVLNCENIYDYRQTKKEAIVIPPYINPSFKQIWAPIEGRVANLSLRINF
jgi:outer membrane receptor for ferrienterochelin and colicins